MFWIWTILSIITNDNSKKIIGFKEIRYFEQTHLIDEFIELFPDTKVICHIDHDINRQCTSGWWTEDDEEVLKEYSSQLILYSKNNQNCYLSCMNHLFIKEKIKKMFEFLGEELNEEKYNYVINNNLK